MKKRVTLPELNFLTALFIGSLLAANLMAVKLWAWGSSGLIQSAGVIAYPITFLITDVVSEIWGKEEARAVVMKGFAAQIMLLILITIGRFLPYPPFWELQGSYDIIFGFVPRVVLASMVAYLISQHHDVWAFDMWRRKTRGKYLWLRNNLSTLVSQAIDTLLFMSIAFIGVFPFHVVLVMMGTQYLTKIIFAIVDTPFCYLSVFVVRRRIDKKLLPK